MSNVRVKAGRRGVEGVDEFAMPNSTGHADAEADRSLRAASSGVVIIAHNEDTTKLNGFLRAEGFCVDEVRGPYAPEQKRYSASMRCLVNHANAWRIAAQRDRATIVVEADFVPVRGFADLPVPVPREKSSNSLAYLYACGPEFWDLAGCDVARGHGGATVALWIPPKVASLLLEFFREEAEAVSPGAYSRWDTKIGYWLMRKGVESYIPYRHYGEHGGIANSEHAVAGLGRSHHADVLQGSLGFVPMYAKGSRFRYLRTRARARVWGVLRLVSGRAVAWHDFRRAGLASMIRFAVGRLIVREPPLKESR
jgi:hypothetical protein